MADDAVDVADVVALVEMVVVTVDDAVVVADVAVPVTVVDALVVIVDVADVISHPQNVEFSCSSMAVLSAAAKLVQLVPPAMNSTSNRQSVLNVLAGNPLKAPLRFETKVATLSRRLPIASHEDCTGWPMYWYPWCFSGATHVTGDTAAYASFSFAHRCKSCAYMVSSGPNKLVR